MSLTFDSEIGSDSDRDYLFGIIRGVVEDERGNIHVFDGIQRSIREFAPDGEIVSNRTLPQGEGPGESLRPSNLEISNDGQIYYMYDQSLHRLTALRVSDLE